MTRLSTMSRFNEEIEEPEVATECVGCGKEIYKGQEYTEWENEAFCDKYCLVDSLDMSVKVAGE